MKRITVLYDGGCGLCVRCARWLRGEPAYLRIETLPARSEEAWRRFADVLGRGERVEGMEGAACGVDAPGTRLDELIVISDEGGVYRGLAAWIMCLYALKRYRAWSVRLARPGLRPLARAAVHQLAVRRRELSALWFADETRRLSDAEPAGPPVDVAPRADDGCSVV